MTVLISVLVLLLLSWVLFTPIILKIDTYTQLYLLQWRGIGSVSLQWIKDDLLVQLSIWFWKKDFYPIQAMLEKAAPSKKAQPKKTKRKWGTKNWKRKAQKLFTSFQVKKFRLVLDTGDYIQNSYLFPVFHFLSRPPWQLSVSYQDDSALQLHVENRLIYVLRALLFWQTTAQDYTHLLSH